MAEATKRVRVTGRVQGVSFRAWTQARAERLHLRGWVRNEPDGSVAALISGDAAQVDRMLSDLQDGPMGAAVERVSAEDADAPVDAGFEIRF